MSVNSLNNNLRAIVSEVGIITDRPAVFEPNATLFADELRAASARAAVDLEPIFQAAAQRYDLPLDLLTAVARAESNFRQDAVSHAGAMGVMQLMPGTARHLGVTDPFDPHQNIMGGARYLREQLDRFDGDVRLALAAYNAGWPTVKRHGGIPPFAETQNYVALIMGWLEQNDEQNNAAAGMQPATIDLSLTPQAATTAQLVPTSGNAGHMSEQQNQNENDPNLTATLASLNDLMAEMLRMKVMNLQMETMNNSGTRPFI